MIVDFALPIGSGLAGPAETRLVILAMWLSHIGRA